MELYLDLAKFSEKFFQGKNKSFSKAIAQALATCTALEDLKISQDCVAEFKERFPLIAGTRIERKSEARVLGALFTDAIVSYARATGTQSDTRVGAGIIERMNESQKTFFRRVMTLRNDALAHFGPGDGIWVLQAAVIKFEESRTSLIIPNSRANYRSDFIGMMSFHLDEVLILAANVEAERRSRLLSIFLKVWSAWPYDLQKLAIAECRFDASDVFTSIPSIRMFYDGDVVGHVVVTPSIERVGNDVAQLVTMTSTT